MVVVGGGWRIDGDGKEREGGKRGGRRRKKRRNVEKKRGVESQG